MTTLLVILLVAHVVPAMFWAGSTFTLARLGSAGAVHRNLAPAQAGSAGVTVLAGLGLWAVAHRGAPAMPEFVLGAGALMALTAAGLQQGMAWRALRLAPDDPAAISRFVRGQRYAGLLLAATLITMVTFRYAA